jgi:adenine-specific DNA-methyltransferase
VRPFVTTRYHGSKQRLLPFLERVLGPLAFDSALDLFGGTGAVSHLLKRLGRTVQFNDDLRANHACGLALVENPGKKLDPEAAQALLAPREGATYDDFIQRTFDDVYYLPAENAWLDRVAQNLAHVPCRFERSLALFAVFQACLKKRPYGLFHRKNLHLRTADVKRSFGNKTTWDKPFEPLFFEALAEANAAVFDDGRPHRATCLDAFECPIEADLVYIDPPYVRADGSSFDYLGGYHFLEGISEYEAWPARIDKRRVHRPYRRRKSPFTDRATAEDALGVVFARAKDARYLVVSYRSDGVPDIQALARRLGDTGRDVEVHEAPSRFVLSRRPVHEVVLVATRR